MPQVDYKLEVELPTVVLYTRGEGKLHKVATIKMLPFTPWPEMVVWGERFFVRESPASEERPVYAEGMAWFVPPELWAEPTWETCHPVKAS
jgi:hypothetical protein